VPSYKTWSAGLASALVLAAATWLYAGFGGKAHLMDQNCSYCHLGGKEVDPARASRLIGSQELLCGICHTHNKIMSHPTGFKPVNPLPADLPLDWKGDLTCSTCHEVHGNMPSLMRGARQGKALCLACHEASFFTAMKDRGMSLRASGHALARLNDSTGIDALSLHCMGCHNDRTDALGVQVSSDGLVRHNSGGANHPIAVAYPSGGDYRPRGDLPKAIWLPDGKLSCVSCHQPYKKEHGKLVVTNEGSALCLQCHIR
jgi:predicted CXXCH cytochrome family protein